MGIIQEIEARLNGNTVPNKQKKPDLEGALRSLLHWMEDQEAINLMVGKAFKALEAKTLEESKPVDSVEAKLQELRSQYGEGCICSNRAVQDYEGPVEDCPIHGNQPLQDSREESPTGETNRSYLNYPPPSAPAETWICTNCRMYNSSKVECVVCMNPAPTTISSSGSDRTTSTVLESFCPDSRARHNWLMVGINPAKNILELKCANCTKAYWFALTAIHPGSDRSLNDE